MVLIGIILLAVVGLPAFLEGNTLAEAGHFIEAGPYRLISVLGCLTGSASAFGGSAIVGLASKTRAL